MWMLIRILIAIVFLAVLEFYFIKKSTSTIKQIIPNILPKTIKRFRWIFLIVINLFPLILISAFAYASITSQSPSFTDSTWLDYLIIYPFWFLFILTFQLVIYYLLFDIIRLIIYPIYKKHKEKYLKYESYLVLILFVFFLIYIPARIIYDYHAVDVKEINFTKTDLPASLNNFKLVFISDIHADRYTNDKRLKNFIDKVNAANPDLVLIGGDFITSTPKYINKAAKYIGMIKSKYGVYSCVGDHDNWVYRQDSQRSIKEISDALKKYNVEMIDNKDKVIPVGNSSIGISFITNTYVKQISTNVLDSLLNSNNAYFKILLVHQPKQSLIDAAEKKGYDLLLAGHTHGGQLTLLFPFIQLTPTLVETTFIRGEKYYGKMLAIVTHGLGMSIAPVRYNSTPEVVVIKFQ